MPGRQSRQKSRDSLRANRARCVLTSSSTRQARSRSRSEVSLSDSPDGWTVTRLRTELKYIGIDFPKSTPKSSMLKLFSNSLNKGVARPSRGNSQGQGRQNLAWNGAKFVSAQRCANGRESYSGHSIRNEMTQMQASVAEISRKK